LSIITALTKITAAISDADVLIKLCKAGYLNILGDVFEYLYVPAVVLSEVESKIEDGENNFSLTAVRPQGWLVVIAQGDLKPGTKANLCLIYSFLYGYS